MGWGLLWGLLGGLHCVGMCGPLAALNNRWQGLLTYHGAKGLTYLALFWVLALAGLLVQPLQRVLAWASVVFALVSALGLLGWLPARGRGGGASRWVQGWVKQAQGLPAPWRGVMVGFVNGLIPCHLVYAAITNAASQPRLSAGLFFMVGFIVGTAPALSAVALGWGWLRQRLAPARLRQVTAVMVLMMAAVVLMRTEGQQQGHAHTPQASPAASRSPAPHAGHQGH